MRYIQSYTDYADYESRYCHFRSLAQVLLHVLAPNPSAAQTPGEVYGLKQSVVWIENLLASPASR